MRDTSSPDVAVQAVTPPDLTTPPDTAPANPSDALRMRRRRRRCRTLSEGQLILCSFAALVVVMLLRALVRAGGL